jgi:hypothetical protein
LPTIAVDAPHFAFDEPMVSSASPTPILLARNEICGIRYCSSPVCLTVSSTYPNKAAARFIDDGELPACHLLLWRCKSSRHYIGEPVMARGSKKKYTNKQKRQADHIEEGYKESGVSEDEAERRAWATVNKSSGGGKKSGSGRGKKTKKASFKKGGRKGGKKGGKKKKKKGGRKKSGGRKKGGRKKKS